MPDALPPPPPARAAVEVCPHARAAALRLRRALAKGHPYGRALEEVRAYLIVTRPGLPVALAEEQVAAIAAAIGRPPLPPKRPPLGLLLELATPSQPGGGMPAP